MCLCLLVSVLLKWAGYHYCSVCFQFEYGRPKGKTCHASQNTHKERTRRAQEEGKQAEDDGSNLQCKKGSFKHVIPLISAHALKCHL